MIEFVELRAKRNRGWPWPEDSWGMGPMFGDDGWCHSCGVPKRPQSGPLVLQRKGMSSTAGAWVPNWQFDATCLEPRVAEEVESRFSVHLRKVEWHGSPPGDALQIVQPEPEESWFDSDELHEAAVARHGSAGATCSECGVWKWLPVSMDEVSLRTESPLGGRDITVGPEWFGDGLVAFRQTLVRRELADLITAASPRDFETHEVS